MESRLVSGASVTLKSVIRELRERGYSDTPVQFFFICLLHISCPFDEVVLTVSWRTRSGYR